MNHANYQRESMCVRKIGKGKKTKKKQSKTRAERRWLEKTHWRSYMMETQGRAPGQSMTHRALGGRRKARDENDGNNRQDTNINTIDKAKKNEGEDSQRE